jgi:hypothetical protein
MELDSGTPTVVSDTIDHPELGLSIPILDDRRRTRREMSIGAAAGAVGILGVVMGVGDATSGDSIVGSGFALIGLILLVSGAYEIVTAIVRFTQPIRLIVGEKGFAARSVSGSVAWNEISAIAYDRSSRDSAPVGVAAQARRPAEFAERHSLAGRARARLISRNGWFTLGSGTVMPLDQLLNLMKARLAESRASEPEAADAAEADPAKLMRAGQRARTSRH